MRLSDEMMEVAKEAGIYGPIIEDWASRVRKMEWRIEGSGWLHELICLWEDFIGIFR